MNCDEEDHHPLLLLCPILVRIESIVFFHRYYKVSYWSDHQSMFPYHIHQFCIKVHYLFYKGSLTVFKAEISFVELRIFLSGEKDFI